MIYEFRLPDIGEGVVAGKVLITIELGDEGAGAEKGQKAAATVLPSALAAHTGTRTAAGPATSSAPLAARGTAPLSPAARARALGPVLATPATRKLARDLGVDLRGVFGTGPA